MGSRAFYYFTTLISTNRLPHGYDNLLKVTDAPVYSEPAAVLVSSLVRYRSNHAKILPTF